MKRVALISLPLVVAISGCSLLDPRDKDRETNDQQDIRAIQALGQDFAYVPQPRLASNSGVSPSFRNAGIGNANRFGTGASSSRGVSTAEAFASLARTQKSVISEEDQLSVNVFQVPELSSENLTVESNGAISLPLLGSVRVSGLSIEEAERKIAGLLRRNYMQNPKVSVTRTEQAFKRVTVEGAVTSPGVFPIRGRMTFLQAIALSAGLTDLANEKAIIVFRNGRRYSVNIDLIRKGKAADPILQDDDRIVVLKSDNKVLEKKVIDYLPSLLSPFSLLTGG